VSLAAGALTEADGALVEPVVSAALLALRLFDMSAGGAAPGASLPVDAPEAPIDGFDSVLTTELDVLAFDAVFAAEISELGAAVALVSSPAVLDPNPTEIRVRPAPKREPAPS
jgi:hypothetical protein